jgi:hypothetical protein
MITQQNYLDIRFRVGFKVPENNDPVMFGFEIVIDSVSSPLLNGSITDFLNTVT